MSHVTDVCTLVFGRHDMSEWTALVEDVLHRSKPAAMWFIEYMASSEGRTYIKSVTSRAVAPAPPPPPPHSPGTTS